MLGSEYVWNLHLTLALLFFLWAYLCSSCGHDPHHFPALISPVFCPWPFMLIFTDHRCDPLLSIPAPWWANERWIVLWFVGRTLPCLARHQGCPEHPCRLTWHLQKSSLWSLLSWVCWFYWQIWALLSLERVSGFRELSRAESWISHCFGCVFIWFAPSNALEAFPGTLA